MSYLEMISIKLEAVSRRRTAKHSNTSNFPSVNMDILPATPKGAVDLFRNEGKRTWLIVAEQQ